MKKKISILLGVLLIVCCGLTACGGKQEEEPSEYSDYYHGIDFDTELGVVAQNGESEYSIVLPADANESENFAALELQNFLIQSTGTSVRITTDDEVTWSEGAKYISLGKNKLLEASGIEFDYSTLNLDGFFLKTVGNSLFMDADVDRGLLYAVYDYLEKFVGVRFIADDETYMPELDRLAMYQMDVVEIPDFSMRSYLYGDIYSVYADYDYYVRSRTNDSFTNMDAKHGGRSSVYGRNSQHNFHFYCDPEGMQGMYGAEEGKTLYETYGDEWFFKHPLYGWTVNLLNGITPDGKLDTSMENSVVKTIIEEMKKDIVANPDIVYFNLDQEDGPFFYEYEEGSEESAIVEKYGRTGILIRFMNVVLDELQKWSDAELNGREINIVTFAYSYTVTAPVTRVDGEVKPIDDTVIADDNLYIRMCIYENPVYTYDDPRQDQATIQNITDWKQCASNFFLWGYDMDFANYLWYYPNRGKFADNLRYVKDAGFTFAMFQGTQNSTTNWYGGMNSYIVSKLMWDIDRNPLELYNEYILHYYGATAEPYMHEFFNTFDQHYAALIEENDIVILNGGGNHTDYQFWDLSLLQLGCSILRNAEAAVLADETYTQEEKDKYVERINNVLATPMYMILKNYAQYYPYGGSTGRLAMVQEFVEVAERGAVDRVSEGMTLETFKSQNGL